MAVEEERGCGDTAAAEKAPGKTLAVGLAQLRSQGVIDDKLLQWAEALRKERNLGAHAAEEEVTKENAADVIAFTIAIFEYVYTLSEKYAEFVARGWSMKAMHRLMVTSAAYRQSSVPTAKAVASDPDVALRAIHTK